MFVWTTNEVWCSFCRFAPTAWKRTVAPGRRWSRGRKRDLSFLPQQVVFLGLGWHQIVGLMWWREEKWDRYSKHYAQAIQYDTPPTPTQHKHLLHQSIRRSFKQYQRSKLSPNHNHIHTTTWAIRDSITIHQWQHQKVIATTITHLTPFHWVLQRNTKTYLH